MTAPATVHCLTTDAAYALARRVIKSGAYDEEATRAALEVLEFSEHPTDRATVRWCKMWLPKINADMAQVDADTLAADAKIKLNFTMCCLAVVGGIFGGTVMEAIITAVNGGAM